MLHSGLVIDHDIVVAALQFLQLCLEKSVYKAVAALSLRTSHDKEVIIIPLLKRALQLKFRVVSLAHTGREIAPRILCMIDFLSDLPKRRRGVHPQNLVQI